LADEWQDRPAALVLCERVPSIAAFRELRGKITVDFAMISLEVWNLRASRVFVRWIGCDLNRLMEAQKTQATG
jgi:hypothetical protein